MPRKPNPMITLAQINANLASAGNRCVRLTADGKTETFRPTEAVAKRPPQYKHRSANVVVIDTPERVVFQCCIVVVSEMNTHGHHFERAARFDVQAHGIKTMLLLVKNKPAPPVDVRLIRLSPRTIDDDNLAGAFKRVRDTIARWYMLDDADGRIVFSVGQERDAKDKRNNGLRIEIVSRAA
jgi:hypothetical protein